MKGAFGEGQMDQFDLVMLIPALVLILLPVIPVLYLLKRVGMSLAWALLLLIPGYGLIAAVWVIAFGRWRQFGID